MRAMNLSGNHGYSVHQDAAPAALPPASFAPDSGLFPAQIPGRFRAYFRPNFQLGSGWHGGIDAPP